MTLPYLDTITPVNLDIPFVILPEDAKLNDPFGDLDDLKRALILWVLLEERPEGGGDFRDGPKGISRTL